LLNCDTDASDLYSAPGHIPTTPSVGPSAVRMFDVCSSFSVRQMAARKPIAVFLSDRNPLNSNPNDFPPSRKRRPGVQSTRSPMSFGEARREFIFKLGRKMSRMGRSVGVLLWQTLSVSEIVVNAFQGWIYR